MAGNFFKAKGKNHKFVVNFGTADAPEWYLICYGILSRGNNFSEDTQEYTYMCGGTDTDVSEQTIVRTFSGHRFLGDPAQDAVFIDRLPDLNNREVQVYEWYEKLDQAYVNDKGNGWSYSGTIVITDDGSGDAGARENIGFNIAINGIMKRGTLTVGGTEDAPTYDFDPITP